ncbi:hypothetical protein CU103_12245 [Phyllobacterium sophorae]|uniref:Uncharacterized protein n=1 Tax=Phyllobacterium sophorae TaxID=1520277 RepID=A0A2P7BDW8_9HYPH|nr:hypothetical protein CU103_12245 [Phyllobacterium sophorae]
MTKYNKAFVPLVMGVIYLINAKYGVQLPIGETEAAVVVTLVTSFLTWLIPNKKVPVDVDGNK